MAAISQDLVADLAAACSVDENASRRDLARQPPSDLIEPDDVAVLGEDDLRAPGHAAGNPRVPGKLAVLPVYRHEVARSDQGDH